MAMYLEGIYGGIGQGMLFSLVAIGIFLTFRILKSPDLTLEGSFALGGAIAMVSLNAGLHFSLVLILAPLGGALAGLLTGLIHTKLKIDLLVSGLLVTMALFSINLYVMNGPTQSAPLSTFVFTPVNQWLVGLGMNPWMAHLTSFIVVGIVIVSLIVTGLTLLFKTSFGLSLRATGSNLVMSQANGVNTDVTKISLLVLANSIIALAGVLVVQQQAGASIQSGSGVLVIGLGSLVLAEAFTPQNASIFKRLCLIVFGASLYFSIVALVILSGVIDTNGTRLLQALIALFALALPKLQYTPQFIKFKSMFKSKRLVVKKVGEQG